MLSRDEIINIKDCKITAVEIPEWGGTVYLHKWNGKDRSLFLRESIRKNDDGAGVNWDTLFDNQVLVVALSLSDENGAKLFSTSPEDLEILSLKDGNVIQMLYEKSLILNGLAQKSLEEAAKN
ncbi:MAG: hypothetical protein PHS33_09175 [Candidatus Omnitrophica bacterium]|nr:hypothetical protein [Candidatus Omnitrophota bacterium]